MEWTELVFCCCLLRLAPFLCCFLGLSTDFDNWIPTIGTKVLFFSNQTFGDAVRYALTKISVLHMIGPTFSLLSKSLSLSLSLSIVRTRQLSCYTVFGMRLIAPSSISNDVGRREITATAEIRLFFCLETRCTPYAHCFHIIRTVKSRFNEWPHLVILNRDFLFRNSILIIKIWFLKSRLQIEILLIKILVQLPAEKVQYMYFEFTHTIHQHC